MDEQVPSKTTAKERIECQLIFKEDGMTTRGTLYVDPGERIIDLLNGKQRFLAFQQSSDRRMTLIAVDSLRQVQLLES